LREKVKDKFSIYVLPPSIYFNILLQAAVTAETLPFKLAL